MKHLALNIDTKEVICTGTSRDGARRGARHFAPTEGFCVRPIDNPELNRQAADLMGDENLHTARAIFLAHCLDTAHGASIIYLLEEIKGRHELEGELTHHDVTLRDALARECENYLKIMGKF